MNSFHKWALGIAFERDFWDGVMATSGSRWPEAYRAAVDPLTPLDGEVVALLQAGPAPIGRGYRILDVGAGPLSPIGKIMPGYQVEIVPTDPLAAIYDELLAKHNVAPPNRTIFAPAEDLSSFFPSSSFDLVYCANALDHSFQPFRGICEMLRVVRVGGCVVLRHSRNEAESESYSGFHQYNFDIIENKFVIWNRNYCVVVDDELPISCELIHRKEGSYVHTRIAKNEEFDDVSDLSRLETRIRWIYSEAFVALAELALSTGKDTEIESENSHGIDAKRNASRREQGRSSNLPIHSVLQRLLRR